MAHLKETQFKPASVAVITISDTRTKENDTSGDLIESKLREAGHQVAFRTLIRDEKAQIRNEVELLLSAGRCQFIILTGGTGLAERDVTPEAIRPLYSKEIPGFGELFRWLSFQDIGTATIQSRAEAGLCGHAVVMALPGSTNACRLAMDQVILPQMDNRNRPCSFRSILPDVPA